MNRFRVEWIVGTIAVVAVLSAGLRNREVVAEDDVLRTPQRLLTEERRQLDVRRRANTIVRRINWLLDDLESNGLTADGGGDKLAEVNKVLADVGKKNVPITAALLRKARLNLK
ncbi:MAG: hypothetical protein VB835_07280, partial [Pirellulales bacterium]